jgi:hypothetical protein
MSAVRCLRCKTSLVRDHSREQCDARILLQEVLDGKPRVELEAAYPDRRSERMGTAAWTVVACVAIVCFFAVLGTCGGAQ